MSRSLRVLLLICLALSLFTGCQAQPTATPVVQMVVITATPADTATPIIQVVTATPMPATVTPVPSPTPEEIVLEIVGTSQTKTFTYKELAALPSLEGWAGIKSSTGKITPPEMFTGVSLLDLCKMVGPFDENYAVNVVAKDGYAMTFSYDQITSGAFTAFDPGTGDELKRDEPLQVVVAYARDGKAMPEDTDGTLRLAILTPKGDQVTDGHWSVKWVRQLVVKPASSEWTLHLEGAITEDMDRNTFESGAAPNCHLAEWVDDEGQKWGGIPLYYLLGRVDDEIKHEGAAFNVALAEQGYQVDVVAADGYKVSFDSKNLIRNKTIILAHVMDGEPLKEDVFPLRLVGSGLKKNEMVGSVAQVVLHVDAIEAPAAQQAQAEPTSSPADESPSVEELEAGTLHFYGKFSEPIAFTQADLQQIGLVKLTVEHPKKGPMDVEGVRINDLLERCKPESGASKLVFTAADGYSAEAPLSDVAACQDCLVTLDGEGFALVMPDLQSGTWVKDVRLIELK